MKRLTTRDESGYYHLRRGPKGGEINKITVVQHLGRMEDVALRTVSREQVEQMRSRWVPLNNTQEHFCESCGVAFNLYAYCKNDYQFCPACGAPMTDEAVEMVMERMEALKDGKGD